MLYNNNNNEEFYDSCLSSGIDNTILIQIQKQKKKKQQQHTRNNEKEKTAFKKNIIGEDDIAYSFYISEKIKSAQPYSLSLFHRNLILSSSQALKKQLFSANDTAIINKYNEWINIKKYLATN